ncbi:MAG TPA: hypothetical protein VF765_35480 [Polyangiaceae bacterium]
MTLPARTAARHKEPVVVLRHPRGQAPLVTRVRAALLLSSLRTLRSRGLFERYLDLLPRKFHDPILGAVSGTWVDVGIAAEHYRACDALSLTVQDQMAMGGAVGDAVNGTFLRTLFHIARTAGVTPWVALKQYTKLWERIFDGGDVEVDKLGPKEALVQMYGLPLFSIPYIRVALRGMHQTGFMLFCTKCYMTDLGSTPTSHAYRAAWV